MPLEVKNRFIILHVDGNNLEDLWIETRDIVIETIEKCIPKYKRNVIRGMLQNS